MGGPEDSHPVRPPEDREPPRDERGRRTVDVGVPIPPERELLAARIRRLIADVKGAEVAVYYHHLGSGTRLEESPDLPMHAASTMKVPVMIELFRRADERAIDLDGTTTFQNRFASIVDGSPYTLSKDDDADPEPYALAGTPVTWRALNEHMITRSSNLATNVLIDRLGAAAVNATARRLGADGITVLRGVEDQKAFDKGLNNTTTARALGVLLEAIETGAAASPAACAAMRDVLLRQTERGEIPAGLPPDVKVAHKTGWITATTHDAAIVYPPRGRPYVLVVLTRNIADRTTAQRLIADISAAVWESASASR